MSYDNDRMKVKYCRRKRKEYRLKLRGTDVFQNDMQENFTATTRLTFSAENITCKSIFIRLTLISIG